MELHSFQWLVAECVFMRASFIRDWVKGIWGNTPLISDDTPHQYKPLLHVIRFYSSFQTSHRNSLYTALHIHVKLSFCYYLGMEEKKSINYTCARMCNVLKYAIFPFTEFHAFFKDLIMQKKKIIYNAEQFTRFIKRHQNSEKSHRKLLCPTCHLLRMLNKESLYASVNNSTEFASWSLSWANEDVTPGAFTRRLM